MKNFPKVKGQSAAGYAATNAEYHNLIKGYAKGKGVSPDAYQAAEVANANTKTTSPHSSPDPHTPNYKVGGTPMKLMKKKVK